MEPATTIRAYIRAQRKDVQPLLIELYSTIRANAPKAKEAIRYGMPTFIGNKNLIHFAVAKHHLGLYPTPSAIVHFEKELSPYSTSKGAVQFPLDAPLPKRLIARIVKFRVREDAALV
jgi:uncharacterized protein YdhG (YjbR/CyaY superfamily)